MFFYKSKESLHFEDVSSVAMGSAVKGINEGLDYLSSKGIKAKDQWGETIISQIIAKEIWNKSEGDFFGTMWGLRFAKYELD
ncbi:hypothetical protein [Paenibacillus sp. NEAU-GSW1]|uniref:hypothetical protein n=1 Tax=Paenibacillus sp. NEAU-GSW1 TaxID=2682486 RepID=UPI0012E31620|nr:hypothetical protein [Paenibacillus sp. NEAU-GSW1]MUT68104.1 hypothetical protein [Paenibacillus sp. NEAU-GSW1]